MKNQDSPAVAFVRHLWDNNLEATGHSWTRLNGAMSESVGLAIRAGLAFELDDIGKLYKSFRGEFWFGEQNGDGWYRVAIDATNERACKAIENYRGRKPFVFDGRRIAVGTQIWWPERKLAGKVTSFLDNDDSVIICTYDIDPATNTRSNTPTKRFTIKRNEFVEREKARKGKKALDNDMREIRDWLQHHAGTKTFPKAVTVEMLAIVEKWTAAKRKSARK